MAPAIAILDSLVTKVAAPAAREKELRRRNEELEREVREGREREAGLRREVERALARLRLVEEAEERLCAELGELEAEAAAQDRAYRQRIWELTQQLAAAQAVVCSSSSSSSSLSSEN